ncbi:MAG: serine/threonine protein kinase, partial [Deltaproteobacteria bacterium]|nr:serine/threonine protein kinase [Deltaproteobacteria bacterium]
HANIVQILDLGQVDAIWYIAMEYVHGRDLGAVLRRARSKGLWLPVPHAVFIAIELLKGLEYAHQRQVMRGGRPVALNIIHRDISPPNVLLSFQGEVKLTDFGIARASLKAMETFSGVVRGRFDYMSPEQAAGAKDLDQRSDLFSVGVVLYEMLTGSHPFRTENELGTIERIRTGQYSPVSKRNPEVPFALEAIVDRALRADKNERYPTATAFKEALDKFFHDSGFIFTHATLAAYVKGLFPEAVPKVSTGPQAPRRVKHRRGSNPEESDELELEPETASDIPTRYPDKPSPVGLPRPQHTPTANGNRNADNEPSSLRSAPLLALPGFGDDATAEHRGDWDDDQPTALRPNPFGEEPATVIRRTPLVERSDPATQRVERTGVRSPAPRSTKSSPRARDRRTVPAIGWLGWVLALLSLCFGLALGAGSVILIGAVADGLGATTPDGASLRILAPPGTAVLVNGDAIGSEVRVEPGEVTHIEVRLPGREPWTQDLTLRAGELRIVVVTPADVPAPVPPPAPSPPPAAGKGSKGR